MTDLSLKKSVQVEIVQEFLLLLWVILKGYVGSCHT